MCTLGIHQGYYILESDLLLKPLKYILRVTLEIVFWICDTFDNNLDITNDFIEYLNESCL